MLVLTRKIGEAIVMPGCGVVVTVLRVQGNKVRLGITAPDGVLVFRQEVWDRRHQAGALGARELAVPGAGLAPAEATA
jgi:carbon storage regulator